MKVNWTGFSKKTPAERLQMLKEKGLLQDEHWQLLDSQQTLPLETANQMSENVLATLALPYSLVPDFLVDGKSYQSGACSSWRRPQARAPERYTARR